MKIVVITCYRDPDYIRARVLRASLSLIEGVEVITIKNSHAGLRRYPEVVWKIIKTRFSRNPDIYVLTFRGYELLPFVRMLSIGKPMIYDELINAVEWAVLEHKKISGLPAKLFGYFYQLLAKGPRLTLADTASHADISSAISKVDRRKYAVIPVGTDEVTFTYREPVQRSLQQPFRVFFYGYMLPLHGAQYVIEAAELLKDNADIEFVIAGRTEKYLPLIAAARQRGARITHKSWIPYDELPDYINQSAVNIAGPFGDTVQSHHVINGKTYQFLASGALALIGESKDSGPFVNHRNCLVVPQADAAAIAREITWAFDNQHLLPEIIQAGRKLYDEQYSNHVIAGQLDAVIKTIV